MFSYSNLGSIYIDCHLISKTSQIHYCFFLVCGMLEIVSSSSFHWYYIHGSRMCRTHITHNFRTLYVVSKIQGGITSNLIFLQMTQKNTLWVSGNEVTIYIWTVHDLNNETFHEDNDTSPRTRYVCEHFKHLNIEIHYNKYTWLWGTDKPYSKRSLYVC